MAWGETVGTVAACGAFLALFAAMIAMDGHERELIKGGHCIKLTETLYAPPPSFHSSCHGTGKQRYCTTWYSQAAPYMRSLWRCADPENGGRTREFWRRTSEEFEE